MTKGANESETVGPSVVATWVSKVSAQAWSSRKSLRFILRRFSAR